MAGLHGIVWPGNGGPGYGQAVEGLRGVVPWCVGKQWGLALCGMDRQLSLGACVWASRLGACVVWYHGIGASNGGLALGCVDGQLWACVGKQWWACIMWHS